MRTCGGASRSLGSRDSSKSESEGERTRVLDPLHRQISRVGSHAAGIEFKNEH